MQLASARTARTLWQPGRLLSRRPSALIAGGPTIPLRALLPLLRRFAAYTASTCGVEQDFSKFKRALGECRGFGPQAEERIAVLSSRKSTPDDDLVLAKSARLIWASCFGAPRSTRLPRLPLRPEVVRPNQRGNSNPCPSGSAWRIGCWILQWRPCHSQGRHPHGRRNVGGSTSNRTHEEACSVKETARGRHPPWELHPW